MRKAVWVVLLLLSACAPHLVRYRARVGITLNVDGNDADWSNVSFHFFKNHGISVGVAHDDAYLYILVRSFHPRKKLWVWVDPACRHRKHFGFRFGAGGPYLVREGREVALLSGFSAIFRVKGSVYLYEMKIPLSEISSNELDIGVEWGDGIGPGRGWGRGKGKKMGHHPATTSVWLRVVL